MRRRVRTVVLVLSLGVGAAGCDGGGGSEGGGGDLVSCTTTFPTNRVMCEEIVGLSAAGAENYRDFCLTLLTPQEQADFELRPCSHVGAVGGCRIAQGPTSVTEWYYAAAGFTAADVKTGCSGNGATFIPP